MGQWTGRQLRERFRPRLRRREKQHETGFRCFEYLALVGNVHDEPLHRHGALVHIVVLKALSPHILAQRPSLGLRVKG